MLNNYARLWYGLALVAACIAAASAGASAGQASRHRDATSSLSRRRPRNERTQSAASTISTPATR